MGRRRQHDEITAAALLEAAEQILTEHGLNAVTVRGVAEAVSATTRSVYSTYGSKEALLAALGMRAFDMLGADVRALPTTDDPVADLTAAATGGFRRFALAHPALFQLGIQQTWLPSPVRGTIVPSAAQALTALHERLARAQQAGALGGRTVAQAAVEFHALCEGMASAELRGFLPHGHADATWDDAFACLLNGWQHTPAKDPPT